MQHSTQSFLPHFSRGQLQSIESDGFPLKNLEWENVVGDGALDFTRTRAFTMSPNDKSADTKTCRCAILPKYQIAKYCVIHWPSGLSRLLPPSTTSLCCSRVALAKQFRENVTFKDQYFFGGYSVNCCTTIHSDYLSILSHSIISLNFYSK